MYPYYTTWISDWSVHLCDCYINLHEVQAPRVGTAYPSTGPPAAAAAAPDAGVTG